MSIDSEAVGSHLKSDRILPENHEQGLRKGLAVHRRIAMTLGRTSLGRTQPLRQLLEPRHLGIVYLNDQLIIRRLCEVEAIRTCCRKIVN